MTSESYTLVGTPNDYNALATYLRAYYTPIGASANLNSQDNVNYTIDIWYNNEPTDADVQYLMDILNAYQDPPYIVSYSETQINSCLSEWSSSTSAQVLATTQIPAYILQAALMIASPNFVVNTMKWLIEFDLSDPSISNDAQIGFSLVDITNSQKRVLKSLELQVGDLKAASFSNNIQPGHVYKTVTFDDLALENPSTTGVWQLEVTSPEYMRVRTVSQQILWYTIQFGANYTNPPALPINVPPQKMYKLPSNVRTNLGSSPVTVESPSWSSVTGPSGKDYTVEPADSSGYPQQS